MERHSYLPDPSFPLAHAFTRARIFCEGSGHQTSNDTADSDDVDSGVSPEHVHAQDCPDSQESDVAISFLCSFKGLIMV